MLTPFAHPTHSSDVQSYYIGLMSGTSMDGVDGVVVDLCGSVCKVIAHHSLPFSVALKTEMLALNTAGSNELHRAHTVANQLTLLYAQVVAGLLYSAELESCDIKVIGAHGQTVRHCPSGSAQVGGGYTIQLNNPAMLAERTNIDVVADFRSRDVAAGGQGAPLVPAFHQAMFGRTGEAIAVLNIGGIANLSLLHADGRVQGFDTGPGNVLCDMWCALHKGTPYDAYGDWAASGKVSEGLLSALSHEAYFDKPIPKSTGRDLFNWDWLQSHVQHFSQVTTQDIQATLVDLTASAISIHLKLHQPDCEIVYVCGGGALNHFLMARLCAMLKIDMPHASVLTTDALGMPVMQVEAAAFAWLAKQCLERHPLSLETITGARGSRVLGAVYPA